MIIMLIRDFAVSVVIGAILLLSLSKLIGRFQFSLSNAFWLSFIGHTIWSIIGFIIGLFSLQTQTADGTTTNINVIALLIGFPIGCLIQAVIFQIAARTQNEILALWRAIILSVIVILGDLFIASPLIAVWEHIRA